MQMMCAADFGAWMAPAIGEVLESMCFLPIGDRISGESGDHDWLACRLSFFGDPNGSFGVQVPEATSRMIAANFLGEDEQDLSSGQVMEVLCEISNMICGSILGQLNPKRTFALSSPVLDLHTDAPSELAGLDADRIRQTYALDEGAFHAWLEVEANS